MLLIQAQLVAGFRESDSLATSKNLMAAMLLVPFGEGGGHVHFFDDVPPAYARIVGAEADLAFLSGIGDNALLGAPEIVVVKVLKPHAGDKEEVPTIGAPLLDVILAPLARDASVLLLGILGSAKGLIEFLQQIGELEMRGRLVWIVIPHHGQRHAY